MALVHCVVPRVRLVQSFPGPSMTKQAFKDECDVNMIMKKFERTGMVAHLAQYQGSYADVSAGLDFQASLDMVQRAHDAFMTLPAKVRKRFENDPGAFLDFVNDPANEKEMIELGLKEAPQPAPVTATEPAPAA